MHGRRVRSGRAAATKATQEAVGAAARAQADAAAKAQAEEALRNQPPQLVIPLRTMVPEIPVPPPEEAGRD